MDFLTLVAIDGALHLCWSILTDNVSLLRKLTHRNAMEAATKELIAQIKALDAEDLERLQLGKKAES